MANGLTNAQIADRLSVSPRTVVTQIESASNRLGATSRTQAAAMYRSLTGSAGRGPDGASCRDRVSGCAVTATAP